MKFYYDTTGTHSWGEKPNLKLAKVVRLVPWTQELENKWVAVANDWNNPLANLSPVYDVFNQFSWEFAEVASEKEARELIAEAWAQSWYEYTHDL